MLDRHTHVHLQPQSHCRWQFGEHCLQTHLQGSVTSLVAYTDKSAGLHLTNVLVLSHAVPVQPSLPEGVPKFEVVADEVSEHRVDAKVAPPKPVAGRSAVQAVGTAVEEGKSQEKQHGLAASHATVCPCRDDNGLPANLNGVAVPSLKLIVAQM